MLKGLAHKYGANVDTDAIIPARYLNVSDAKELACHCMEDIDLDFGRKVKRGDFIVASTNFGCGSSREHAPIAIKESGISAIIAKSFARIFFRNAVNIGLPLLECATAVDCINEGDEIQIEIETGRITNLTSHQAFQAKPYPIFMTDLIKAGGLIEYTKTRIKERKVV